MDYKKLYLQKKKEYKKIKILLQVVVKKIYQQKIKN